MTHPLVQQQEDSCSNTPNARETHSGKQVHFDGMEIDSSDSTDTTPPSPSPIPPTVYSTIRNKTGLQLIGIPFTINVDLSWTCTKLRYVIWEQYVRKYFLKVLIEESDCKTNQAYDISKVRMMLKNIKVQSLISGLLNIRFVSLDGEGVRCSYNGPIVPKYAIPPIQSPWSTAATTSASTHIPVTVQDTTTKPLNDDILGDSLPINNIPIHFLLHPKNITMLSVDYQDDVCMNHPQVVFSWLNSLDLREVTIAVRAYSFFNLFYIYCRWNLRML